ncbi:hypothetical protein BWZ22_11065 [Seonamhaeicola sp. S2-3]|uniref:hypothetical protein n=1 Tax=Seonamhaeicola sp. S2-3 TaxID=1936081 RepID=UPI0009729CA7|nr:hypothetical protein [Seonamhaeicola sp. S2-3]APY11744.1 hypothetical protein BWZ22_11065 [Seonamhaeicola sp. S2-3]
MKKYILPILIFLFSLNVTAQKDRNKIHALKVSFITEQLDLTEQEAQKFWPVYNDHNKKMSNLKYQEMRALRKELKSNIETLTEEKALEFLKKINSIELKEHKYKQEYAAKLKTILSAKKIIKLRVAEEDFKRKMLERWKYHKNNHRQ